MRDLTSDPDAKKVVLEQSGGDKQTGLRRATIIDGRFPAGRAAASRKHVAVKDDAAFNHIDLNALMLFYQVAHADSISQAALRFHVPKATLSRKLRQLESQIGAVLLKRTTHKVSLTEVGTMLLHYCETIASSVEEASRRVAEMRSQPRGTLRISVPQGLVRGHVNPAITQLVRRCPDVTVAVHAADRWVDVSEEPFDVVIHLGKVCNEHLPVRRLAELRRGVYASPEYLARHGRPSGIADLMNHDCVAVEVQLEQGLWDLVTLAAGDGRKFEPRVRVSEIESARELAVGGAGIVILAEHFCAESVRRGELVQILPEWHMPPIPVTASFLEHRHLPKVVRIFLDLVTESFSS